MVDIDGYLALDINLLAYFIGDSMNEEGTKNRFSVLIGVSISVVAVVVSVIQVYAAIQNNRLVEAQTIESFIPHLMKNETKDIALVAMNRYVDRSVVNEMASLLKSEVALQTLAKKGTAVERVATKKVLIGLNQERVTLVEQMFSDIKSERIVATTSLVRNWNHTSQLLEDALTRAKKTPDNKSGVINTLVLLSAFDPSLIVSYGEDLEEFFKMVEKNGPQTRSRITKLREILNQDNNKIQPTAEGIG